MALIFFDKSIRYNPSGVLTIKSPSFRVFHAMLQDGRKLSQEGLKEATDSQGYWAVAEEHLRPFIRKNIGVELYRGFVSPKDDMNLPLLRDYLQKMEHEFLAYEISIFIQVSFLLGEPFSLSSLEKAIAIEVAAYRQLRLEMELHFNSKDCYELRSLDAYQQKLEAFFRKEFE